MINRHWLSQISAFAMRTPQRKALGIFHEADHIEWITYKELYLRALIAANHLLRCGLKAGDRALVMSPSSLDFAVTFLGCMFSGIIAVPLYAPRSNRKADRVFAVVEDCDPKAIIGRFDEKSNDLGKILDQLGIFALKIDAPEILNIPISSVSSPQIPDLEAVAFLQYTSGSTGTPKGVMVSHANLTHNLFNIEKRMGFDDSSCFVSWLPLYHDMGLILGFLEPLVHGVKVILMSPFSFFNNPGSWLNLMHQEKATHSAAPNFAYELCVERVEEKQLAKLDLSDIKVIVSAAEPVRYETLNRFQRRFACTGLTQGCVKACYGLAEATLGVSAFRSYDDTSRSLPIAISQLDQDYVEVTTAQQFKPIVSCGVVFDGLSVCIVNPNTSELLADGEVGEIFIQGDSIATGYWQKKEATQKTFGSNLEGVSGSFLRTGDLGFIDKDELFITGRRKDIIILRGRNIYPQDIEHTVQKSWNGFRQGYGAAFSIDDESLTPKLVVVQEVERLFRRRIETEFNAANLFRDIRKYHELDCFEIVLVKPNNVAMTSSGKIQRRKNRRMYLEHSFTVLARFKREDYNTQICLCEKGKKTETREEIVALVYKLVAHHTGTNVEYLNENDALTEYGFDSLMITYLAQCLSKSIGRTIDAVWFLDTPTLGDLIDRICNDGIEPHTCAPPFNSNSLTRLTEDPLLLVEGMSDDRVRRQFEGIN